MFEVLIFLAGGASIGGAVAWRLKGDRTWRELGRAIILGPGPFRPK